MKKIPHISPSQLNSFQRCGEAYRRRYIDGDIIPPSFALHAGSAVHRASEFNFSQKIQSGADLPASQIVEVAVETHKTAVKNEGVYLTADELAGAKKMENESETNVVTFAELYSEIVAPRYQPEAVEERVTIPIPETEFELLGIVDLRTQDKLIVDLKTTSRSPARDAYIGSIQMTVYSLAYEAINKRPPAGIIVENLVNKKNPVVDTITMPARELSAYHALFNHINTMLKALKAGVFPPAYGNAAAWNCSPRSCGYWRTCPYVPLGRREELPNPNQQ